MKLYIFYFSIILSFPDNLPNSEDNSALTAINIKVVKKQYPFLFADYHPAKYAYPDPSFIYFYRYQNTTGEFHRTGVMRKIEMDGFEYIGKEKISPFSFIELEISKGIKTRYYISCGRKLKQLFTREGIPVNT